VSFSLGAVVFLFSPGRQRLYFFLHLLFIAFVLLWGFVQFELFRPENIVNDWMGWRQADTQSIALNFLNGRFNIFYPEVNWAGPVNAFVETELQLYTGAIALMMAVFGEGEWPGQLLSLLSMIFASLAIFYCLRKRFSLWASILGALSLLSFRGVVFLSTSVQPDALAFLFCVLSFVFFLDYIETPKRRTLLWYGLFTALAGLIKPTALSIGIAQGLMVLLINVHLLRRPLLWATWAAVLLVIAAYLLHAASIYKTYGYTFGILSGGDSKSPKLEHLIIPWIYKDLIKQCILWGVNIFGIFGAVYLLIRGKIKEIEVALVVSYSMLCLAALRYMHDEFGEHYHVYAVVLGVWLFAKAIDDIQVRLKSRGATLALVLLSFFAIIGHYTYQANQRLTYGRDDLKPLLSLAEEMKKVIPSSEAIVIRSAENSYNKFWRTVNNFEDPRLFYLSRTKGWIMANDHIGVERIQKHWQRGAKYYVEYLNERKDSGVDVEFYQWLQAHAQLLYIGQNGMIYQFQ